MIVLKLLMLQEADISFVAKKIENESDFLCLAIIKLRPNHLINDDFL